MGSIINNPVVGALIKSSTVRAYDKGQTILYPDDSNVNLYLIKSGAVTMEAITDAGEKKILYIFGASHMFPMVSFTEKSASSSWFYTALVDTEVYVVSYEAFMQELKEIDGFTAYNTLLSQMLAEVHELLLRISDHTRTDSTEKIISMLLFLLEHHTSRASSNWRVVQFPVTHQFLADMTGLTRETVSLALKILAEKKLIRYHEKGKLELNFTKLSNERHA